MTFALYPQEARWWSFSDYGHVLAVVRRLGAKRALEFGPGSSTLALIEGGVEHVDACEDDPAWFTVYRDRLQSKYPAVHLRPYRWQDSLRILGVDGERYDIALVDGPHGKERRPAAVEYCLHRSSYVLAPTEDWCGDHREPGPLAAAFTEIAARNRRHLTITETGPLSGGFALFGPRTC